MSTLWTPSGEHPVDRPGAGPASGPAEAPPAADAAAGAPPGADRELTPEERAAAEEYARQIDAAREQLLAAPAGLVVGQQALQFYELAALHLSQPEPRIDDARVAIDALAGVVERVGSRLGEAEPALRQALNQLQLAFVEVSGQSGAGAPGDSSSPG
jgi:hypothetical protein